MGTKTNEQLAQDVLGELKRQVDGAPGWVNEEFGLYDVEMDGSFNLVKVVETVRKSLGQPSYRVEAVKYPGAGKPTTVHAGSLLDACDVAQGLLNSGLFGHGVEIYSRREGEWKSIYSSSQPWTEEYSLEEYVVANNLDR